MITNCARDLAAVVGANGPPRRRPRRTSRRCTRVSNWMSRAQVEPVGDVVRVLEDLGLRRVALGPLPLLLELVGELVRVLHALDVAARARIAVPVPGAAHAAARLEHARREPEPAQPVQHVHAGEARADDHDVVLRAIAHLLPPASRSGALTLDLAILADRDAVGARSQIADAGPGRRRVEYGS